METLNIKNGENIFLSSDQKPQSPYTIPDGVTQVGNIKLRDSSLTLPKGVTQVGEIVLLDSSLLTLPEGVTQVGEIVLLDSPPFSIPDSVTQVGDVSIWNGDIIIPKGVTQIGNISVGEESSVSIIAEVKKIKNISLSSYSKLTFPESVTQLGDIDLECAHPEAYDGYSFAIPKTVTQIGNVDIADGCRLIFPNGFVLSGPIMIKADEANKLLTKQPHETPLITLGDVDKDFPLVILGSVITATGEDGRIEKYTIPEGVTSLEEIRIFGSAKLVLPNSLKAVKEVFLQGPTSLTLPPGVTQVEKITCTYASVIVPNGVTKVDDICIYSAGSVVLPESVIEVGDIELAHASYFHLPQSVRKVGEIAIHGDDAVILPDEVTQVGNIRLWNGSLSIPASVIQIGDIELSRHLFIPVSVTRIGKVDLLDEYSKLTFSDGFVLNGPISINAEEANKLLAEHSPSNKMSKRAQLHEKAEKNFHKNVIDKIGTNHQIKASNQIKPK